MLQAKWPGYSHQCEGFNERSDLKPQSWNADDQPTVALLAKPELEVRAALCALMLHSSVSRVR